MMTPMDRNILITLLEGMHVPELRLDISKPSNVRWLLRNLGINNPSGHNLTEAIGRLIQLNREQSRTQK